MLALLMTDNGDTVQQPRSYPGKGFVPGEAGPADERLEGANRISVCPLGMPQKIQRFDAHCQRIKIAGQCFDQICVVLDFVMQIARWVKQVSIMPHEKPGEYA